MIPLTMKIKSDGLEFTLSLRGHTYIVKCRDQTGLYMAVTSWMSNPELDFTLTDVMAVYHAMDTAVFYAAERASDG